MWIQVIKEGAHNLKVGARYYVEEKQRDVYVVRVGAATLFVPIDCVRRCA